MNCRSWLSGIMLCLCALVCCSCDMLPVSSGRFINAPEGSVVRWAVPFDGSDSRPALMDSLLFIGSADGGVYCFNARTGAQRWRFQTGEGLRSGPRIIEAESDDLQDMLSAVGEIDEEESSGERKVDAAPVVRDGIVYVGSSDQSFYAIDAETGEARWSTPLGLYPSDDATVSEGAVVATGYRMGIPGPGNSVLFVLDASDGSIKWVTDNRGAVSAPAVSDGVVYCALLREEDFSLVAFELESGAVIWSSDCEGVDAGRPVVTPELVVLYAHLEVKPEIEPEKKPILPPYVTGVYAFERDTGDVRWSYRAPEGDDSSERVPPRRRYMPVDDERVYLASRKGVYALDIETGELVWRHDGEFNSLSLYLGDHIYVGRGWLGDEGRMAIDPESGRVVWETSSPSDMSIWTVLDDRLYGAIYNSMLYGLDPQDGRVLWRFKNNGALFRADPVAFEGGIIFATGTQLVWGGRGAQGYLFSILPGARTAPGKH